MNLQHLESFIQIAEHRGFNRASAHLNIAQSALSRHIKQLEGELGVDLFVRDGRGVQTTPAGERLLVRAESILKQIRQTRDEIAAECETPRGDLKLGLPPSLEQAVGVPLITKFLSLYGEVNLSSKTGTSIELREWVLSGEVDVAVIGILEPESVLESHSFFREPVYVVGASGWVGEGNEKMAMEDVARLPLILTPRPNSLRLLLDNAADRQTWDLKVLMETSSIPMTIRLIRSGVGHAVLPYSCVKELIERHLLSGRPVRNLSFNWVIVHSRERRISAAGRRMVDLLKEQAELPSIKAVQIETEGS